jgi:hypothetical protein
MHFLVLCNVIIFITVNLCVRFDYVTVVTVKSKPFIAVNEFQAQWDFVKLQWSRLENILVQWSPCFDSWFCLHRNFQQFVFWPVLLLCPRLNYDIFGLHKGHPIFYTKILDVFWLFCLVLRFMFRVQPHFRLSSQSHKLRFFFTYAP